MLRFQRAAIAALLGLLAVNGSNAQTAVDAKGKTPAEMAKAVARTIDGSFPKEANGPIRFDGANAHDNVVEVHWTIERDALVKMKASSEDQRRAEIAFFCKDEPRPFIDAGVVIHTTQVSPDGSERREFSVDKKTCASLPPPPKQASPKALSDKAQAVARAALEQANAHRSDKAPFHLAATSAHENVVEMTFVVTDENFARSVTADGGRFEEASAGHACAKYGDDLHRGLTIHQSFKSTDGRLLFEFTFDKSSC